MWSARPSTRSSRLTVSSLPHTASFDEDFSQIQEQVRLDKQMRAIDDFLAGKIKETHIIIDPMFRDCEFRRSGWASKFAED